MIYSKKHVLCPQVNAGYVNYAETGSRRPEGIAKVAEHWKTQVPPHVHEKVAHRLILLYCWEIWRHRNDVVFRGLEPSTDRLVATCKEAAASWSCRIPRKDLVIASNWRSLFSM